MILATPTGRNGSKLAPRRSQDGPKIPQEAPKTAQEVPKMAQEAPRRRRGRPGAAQDGPRSHQDGPKTLQERLPDIGEAQGRLEDGVDGSLLGAEGPPGRGVGGREKQLRREDRRDLTRRWVEGPANLLH